VAVKQWPYEAAAIAFEAIPRTLAQNCGVNVIRTMTALQGKVLTFFCRVNGFFAYLYS
jgi:chaperonin GroEL (HSP60 family)